MVGFGLESSSDVCVFVLGAFGVSTGLVFDDAGLCGCVLGLGFRV